MLVYTAVFVLRNKDNLTLLRSCGVSLPIPLLHVVPNEKCLTYGIKQRQISLPNTIRRRRRYQRVKTIRDNNTAVYNNSRRVCETDLVLCDYWAGQDNVHPSPMPERGRFALEEALKMGR